MEWLSALLGIGGGGFLTKEGIDRLSEVGQQAQTGATSLAEEVKGMTEFKPFTMTSATGGSFGAQRGADGGTDVTMNLSPQEQALQRSLFGGAGQFFNQAQQSTAGRESDIYSRLRAVQRPEEARQRQELENRLASQGRLGVSTAQYGGTPEQLAIAKAQAEAQNSAMLGAMDQAQREQAQQAALGQQFLGASYTPQTQLLGAMQASSLFPQMQQQAQLYGAGQYGETMMSGISANLIAEQAKANLLGTLGSSMLSGVFSPVANSEGGVSSLFGDLELPKWLTGIFD